MVSSNANKPAPGVPYFTPAQIPPAGTATPPQPSDPPLPKLFQPLKIRGVEFHNRIWLSPLIQAKAHIAFDPCSSGGHFHPWSRAYYSRSSGCRTEGRTSPDDVGIWNDSQAEAWAKIIQFAHSRSQKIGVRLAHAGRKASTVAPWIEGSPLALEEVGGWPNDVWAPCAISYHESYPRPKELTKQDIKKVVAAFASAAKRAVKAGFDVIEIHNAHGYLLHEFLSPVSNKRSDEYGGSFENRTRLTLEVVDAIRGVIPEDMPLFLRISGTDWLEESLPNEPSWTSQDTARLGPILFEHGVDLLDVSSGGLHPAQKLQSGPGYQAPFARDALESAITHPSEDGRRLVVSSVGSYTEAHFAEDILQKGWADVIFVGRQFQKNPGLVFAWGDQLGVNVRMPNQIEWAFRGRVKKIQPNGKPKM